MIRVLVADDQELVRSGFRIILQSEPDIEVVGEAANGAEAVRLAAALRPDVICMDVEMPEMNGIEAAGQILAASEAPTPAVLILTTFGHESYLFDALATGVSGFLLKTSKPEQLIEAVRTLAEGGALLDTEVTRTVMQRAASGTSATTDKSNARLETVMTEANLTEREREVLMLVAAGQSNREIAAKLFLGEATVKTHVSNLLQKAGARDRVALIVWVHTTNRI